MFIDSSLTASYVFSRPKVMGGGDTRVIDEGSPCTAGSRELKVAVYSES